MKRDEEVKKAGVQEVRRDLEAGGILAQRFL